MSLPGKHTTKKTVRLAMAETEQQSGKARLDARARRQQCVVCCLFDAFKAVTFRNEALGFDLRAVR